MAAAMASLLQSAQIEQISADSGSPLRESASAGTGISARAAGHSLLMGRPPQRASENVPVAPTAPGRPGRPSRRHASCVPQGEADTGARSGTLSLEGGSPSVGAIARPGGRASFRTPPSSPGEKRDGLSWRLGSWPAPLVLRLSRACAIPARSRSARSFGVLPQHWRARRREKGRSGRPSRRR